MRHQQPAIFSGRFRRCGPAVPVPAPACGRWCRIQIATPDRSEILPPLLAFEDRSGETVGSQHFLGRRAGRASTVAHVPSGATNYRLAGGSDAEFQPISGPAAALLIVAARKRAIPSLLRAALTGRLREQFAMLATTLHRPTEYALWIGLFDTWPAAPPVPENERASIAALVFQHDEAKTSPLQATLASLAAQAIPYTVLAGPQSKCWRRAATGLPGEYLALIQAGEVLPAHAGWLAGAELRRLGSPALAVCDLDSVGRDGVRSDPEFRPQPNRALMLSGTQSRGAWFVRRDVLLAYPDTADPGWAECLRLAIWLRRQEAGEAVGQRIPFILTHCRADAEAAPAAAIADVVNGHLARSSTPLRVAPSFPLVLRAEAVPPESVAIVVPSTLRSALARDCILSILQGTAHRDIELVVGVSQDSPLDAAQRGAASLIEADPRARVMHLPHPVLNFSRVCNALACLSDAKFILLLNDDVRAIAPDWLDEMLAHLADPAVGIVGAKLLYPDQTVQHGGVIMGFGALCAHAHSHLARTANGYGWRTLVAQELSAVTGACLLIRRPVFDELGGLDEAYPNSFNDIDLCLRARERGYGVVFAPAAELIHYESQTYAQHEFHARQEFESEDVARMRQRWAALIADDPFYNPNQDLHPGREWQLAFPPRRAATA